MTARCSRYQRNARGHSPIDRACNPFADCVSKYLLMKADRRQQIIEAAMQVFAQKGFRGSTTRDLATQAGVNEAIIFRYFNTKEELYSAIIEHKAAEHRSGQMEELERLANAGDDEKFFEAVGRSFLKRHEEDSTFLRLLLFSALEGHQLSDMFVSS